jgi:hypothetical protein
MAHHRGGRSWRLGAVPGCGLYAGEMSAATETEEFRLGTFELPENSTLREK